MMRARLTVNSGIASPRVCDLRPDSVANLGRNRDNTIVLHDRHASRWHAQVFIENGRWFIRDQDTTNGTRLDGAAIRGEAALCDGQEIAIGEVRLCFQLHDRETERLPALPADEPNVRTPSPTGNAEEGPEATVLQVDELTALFHFMNESFGEESPQRLVAQALETALRQTQADLAGFLSLDDDPELKIVLPEHAAVDRQISRHLTQRALREGRCVRIAPAQGPGADCESESLANYRDAVCVPLCARPAGDDEPPPPLGALHVYKSNRPFTEHEVRFCQVLAGSLAGALHALRIRRSLQADNSRLRVHPLCPGETLLGSGPAVRDLREQIGKLADFPCTILITGESGVGKELVALGLHRQGRRSGEPLVTVNCAAISDGLPESLLFGHCKGAFTGATHDHAGFFAQADGGTLFLDEIGELSGEVQAKLLRVLETKTFRPVGARAEIKADVRVLAATNRDLEHEVREGRFRADLFYRLHTIRLRVPALREHLEDVPLLAEHFLARFNAEYHRHVTLSEGALWRLRAYSWPGNVRQLRSVLEAAVAMAGADATLHAGDLGLPDEGGALIEKPETSEEGPDLNLADLEAWAIREALARTGGNNTKAAQLLGIHRDTLINKQKKKDRLD